MEIPNAKSILDIKAAKISDESLVVLAVTDSNLYQFSGNFSVIKILLQECAKDSQIITKNSLAIDGSLSGLSQSRQITTQQDDYKTFRNVSLQIYYDQREEERDSKPLGFGWANQQKYCFAQFKFQTEFDKSVNSEIIAYKPLEQKDLNIISYVRKDNDQIRFDTQQRLLYSVITQYHIIFIFETNITFLSSISQEIVFSKTFN